MCHAKSARNRKAANDDIKGRVGEVSILSSDSYRIRT